MQEINAQKYQGREYEQMISSINTVDKKLTKLVTAGAVGTEATQTFLREYYKSSKGTSKFLNSVTFAAEDIAEDINNLKSDLQKYFKGKNSSKTILQDQTESLKRIENNTKGMGFIIASSILSGIAALTKTAFTFNPYLTTDIFTGLAGKSKGFSSKATSHGPFSSILSKLSKSSIAQKMKTAYQESSLGGRGDFAEGVASRFNRMGRDLSGLGKSIVNAWNKSKVTQFAEWFWDVGKAMIQNTWEKQGGIGVTIIGRVLRNYSSPNYKGPHGTSNRTWSSSEEAAAGLQKSIDRSVQKYQKTKTMLNDLGQWEGENYAQTSFAPEEFRILRNKKSSSSNVIKGPWGKGSKQITANPESNTKITSGNIASPKQAWASIIKLQIRIHGLLQRIFKHVKHSDESSLGDLAEEAKGGGGILGTIGAAIAGSKLGKWGKALKGGWKGAAVAAGAGVGAARLAKVGNVGRMLWDTIGYGNPKEGLKSLAQFKKSPLGKTKFGRLLRQLRVANAGFGTGAESRLTRYLLSANRWGGIFDPLGATAGYIRAAGSARNATGLLGASKSTGLLSKIGSGMDAAGKAIKGGASKGVTAVGEWLGKGNVGAAVSKLAKGAGPLGKLAPAMGKIFSKIPVVGGLFTMGLGLKELAVDKDWKSGLWHLFTGSLMAIPATALGGSVLAIGSDAINWGKNKLKDKKKIDPNAAAANAVKGATNDKDIQSGAAIADFDPSGDSYSGTVPLRPGGTTSTTSQQNYRKGGWIGAALRKGYSGAKKVGSAIKTGAHDVAVTVQGALNSGPAGERILAAAKKRVGGNTSPTGYCLREVEQALRDAGLQNIPKKAHAYMYADVLAKRPDMKEVSYAPKDLNKLPAGAIVVWGKGTSPSGHISIADGRGREYSDYVGSQRIKTSRSDGKYYGPPRVFIPQDTSKGTATQVASATSVAKTGTGGYGGNLGRGADPIPATTQSNTSTTAGGSPSANTEISPMIQDYGLAIINNLLFI
ncbi:MAG: hypothetical protein IJH34_09580 [Romboutsia sp.]|nr:hypothetical protein [Romboutsia sp.]